MPVENSMAFTWPESFSRFTAAYSTTPSTENHMFSTLMPQEPKPRVSTKARVDTLFTGAFRK